VKMEWGYVRVTLSYKGRKQNRFIHHLVLMAFTGPGGFGLECRHLDNNPSNNNWENLVWDTPTKNQHDRVSNGTSLRGELNHKAKLSEEDVLEIRQNKNIRQKEFVKKFGLSKSAISGIRNNKTWKHLLT
jgi:hypothetical protein